MAVWAYACRACDGSGRSWYVGADRVAEFQPQTRCVRVRVEDTWACAVLSSEQAVAIDAQLVRDVIASSIDDCPECERALTREPPRTAAHEAPVTAQSRAPRPRADANRATVQAAAISLEGMRFVVVLVRMDVLQSPGEAGMVIDALAPSFGGVPIVLMAQDDDGSPRYYGDAALLALLEGVPVERLPWQDYPVQ